MTQPATTTLSTNDTAMIRESSETFGRLFLSQDFDALAGLYNAEAALLPPHQPAVQGRAQIKAWLKAFPKVRRFKLDILEIDGREDLAYVRGAYSMTIEPEGAPGLVDDAGKYVEIRKKQSDGSWGIAVDIFNSDKP